MSEPQDTDVGPAPPDTDEPPPVAPAERRAAPAPSGPSTGPAGEKVPPQSIEHEMCVLGSLLLDAAGVGPFIFVSLEAADFYHPHHRVIFDVVRDLRDAGKPVDLITIPEELRRLGKLDEIGGLAYLAELADSVPSAANAEHYADIVRERRVLRDTICVCGDTIRSAFAMTEPSSEIVEAHERSMTGIADLAFGRRRSEERIGQITDAAIGSIIPGGSDPTVGTGFAAMDEILAGGLRPGQFIVIGGRPSSGKSALLCNIAEHMAISQGRPVMIYSAEMSKQDMTRRIVCSRAEVPLFRALWKQCSHDELQRLNDTAATIQQSPLWIDDGPFRSFTDIFSRLRVAVRQYKIECAFVDYLQLIPCPEAGRRDPTEAMQLKFITRACHAAAKEIGIPLVVAAQLNRNSVGRESRRPRMGDFRGSDTIEHDSDIAVLVHRPDQHEPDSTKHNHRAEIIFAKQRNGPTGTKALRWNGPLTRFENMTAAEQDQAEQEAVGGPQEQQEEGW